MIERPSIIAMPLPEEALRARITRTGELSLVVAGAGLGLCVLLALIVPSQREPFFRSYLFAYVFWLGLGLGCSAICLLHNLTSGQWGFAARRILQAGNASLPFMLLMSLPLALGALTGHVWPWAAHLINPAEMPHKARFFSPILVLVKTLLIGTAWFSISLMVARGGASVESTRSYKLASLFAKFSGLAIILYVLTLTLACMDWLMSLTPQWYSTVYALIFVTGQVLSAFSFTVIVLNFLMQYEPVAGKITADQINDLASFTFAFVILWAYMSFSQLLISWMGNLKTEMLWYVPRTTGGWGFVAVAILLFQFFAPFLLLLNRTIKRSPRMLAMVAAGIMLMRIVDIYWIIKPSFASSMYPDNRTVCWMDPVLLIAVGAIFLRIFLGKLSSNPLSPPEPLDEYNAVEAVAGGMAS